MQVLVHVSVFEGIVGGFLGGVGGGVEALELGGEAHADFEGVSHGMWGEQRSLELRPVVGRALTLYMFLIPSAGLGE